MKHVGFFLEFNAARKSFGDFWSNCQTTEEIKSAQLKKKNIFLDDSYAANAINAAKQLILQVKKRPLIVR